MPDSSRLLAYHGDPAIKAKYLARVEAHRAADEIVQRFGYWRGGKGCAVGCTIHGDCHKDYESELGIPESIAFLEDAIFEHLDVESAKTWPLRFLTAIEPGSDLSSVVDRFNLWILASYKADLSPFLSVDDIAAIELASGLVRRRIAGDEPKDEEWESCEGSWAVIDGLRMERAENADDVVWAVALGTSKAVWKPMSEQLLSILASAAPTP